MSFPRSLHLAGNLGRPLWSWTLSSSLSFSCLLDLVKPLQEPARVPRPLLMAQERLTLPLNRSVKVLLQELDFRIRALQWGIVLLTLHSVRLFVP